MSNDKNEPSLSDLPEGLNAEDKSRPRKSVRNDLRDKVLDLVKREGYEKLPSEWRFDNNLFDFARSEDLSRVPRLLYNSKKSAQEIRRNTLAAPFQPVAQFGRAKKGSWINQLIWGDNAQALKHLINTGLKGKVRLIYIDPPFATKSDFDKNKEVKAYRDKLAGVEYIEFMRERLVLLRELLAEDGSIYVHLDSKMNSYIRVVMDEIFGKENFINEITWDTASLNVAGFKGIANKRIYATGNILYYRKNSVNYIFNKEYIPRDKKFIEKHYKEKDANGVFRITRQGNKLYLKDDKGEPLTDVWKDILSFNYAAVASKESVKYPTQKPEKLLARIIKASSNEGDIVLDCFCGSGTALAVAEKLGRRWIGVDAGKVAIHTTKTRILKLKNRKPFAVYNSGVYAMKDVDSGIQVDIDEKLYKEFACALFGIDTSKARKEKRVQYDGVGRGNIKTKVFPSRGYVTTTYLAELAGQIGRGKIYLIYSQNQDCVLAHRLKIEGVEFYLHKIPHSIVGQFVRDCGYGKDGDGSAIIRNLHDIVLCKSSQENEQEKGKRSINKEAIKKLGKIAQPKSKKEVDQKFTNIVGFDFVDTTKFDIDVKIETTKDGIRFKLTKVVTPSGEGIDKLAAILVDANYDDKVLKPQKIIWANNSVDENEDGTTKENVGFATRSEFIIPLTNKKIALAYIDDFGNELIAKINL